MKDSSDVNSTSIDGQAALQWFLEKDQAFYTALFAEDDLGAVIRGHLIVEQHLRELIETGLSYPEAINESRWRVYTFDRRVELATALGVLPPAIRPPIEKLEAIRNEFAHRNSHALTDQVATDFVNTFPPPMPPFLRVVADIPRARAPLPELSRPKRIFRQGLLALHLTLFGWCVILQRGVPLTERSARFEEHIGKYKTWKKQLQRQGGL